MNLRSLTLKQFIEALAAAKPTPAGGSACAITGAQAAALVVLSAEATLRKNLTDEKKKAVRAISRESKKLIDRLEELAERDIQVYDEYVHARKEHKKQSPDNNSSLKKTLDHATEAIAQAPFDIAKNSVEALRLASQLAPLCHPNVISDLGVAVYLAEAAMEGAFSTLRFNLPLMEDATLRADLDDQRKQLNEVGRKLGQAARGIIEKARL